MSRAGLCTCHEPPRPMTLESPEHEWAHDDTNDFAEVFHVHVNSHSRDCDGPMDRSHTYQIVSIADCDTKSDLWRKVLGFELSAHAIEQTITINGENYTASFSEVTDEGGHAADVQGCTEPDCAHEGASQRDHYAEAAGY